MTNFDEFKQKAKETMETIADRSVELYKIAEEKTKVIAKTTKLSTEIALEKGALRNLYKELGRMYYDLHGSLPDAALTQTCTEIASALGCISAKQNEIDELRRDYDFAYNTDSDTDTEDDEEQDVEVEIIVEEFENPVTSEMREPADLDENSAEAENAAQNPPEFRL